MRVEFELCNLPRLRIMEYLVLAGGEPTGEVAVVGEGWTAALEKMEPSQVGSIKIPRDCLIIEGEAHAVERVSAFMRKKTMRGGG